MRVTKNEHAVGGTGWLVPGVLAGLIGLCVGMAGLRDVSDPAWSVSHPARATAGSAQAASQAPNGARHGGTDGTAVEGRFCRPVWSVDDSASELAACPPVAQRPRLLSL